MILQCNCVPSQEAMPFIALLAICAVAGIIYSPILLIRTILQGIATRKTYACPNIFGLSDVGKLMRVARILDDKILVSYEDNKGTFLERIGLMPHLKKEWYACEELPSSLQKIGVHFECQISPYSKKEIAFQQKVWFNLFFIRGWADK